jgi:hypothetical protein
VSAGTTDQRQELTFVLGGIADMARHMFPRRRFENFGVYNA